MQRNTSILNQISDVELLEAKENNRLQICYGTASTQLGRAIIEFIKPNLPSCEVELVTKKFADGEICTEYSKSIRGCDLFIIQSVCRPNVNQALMELILAVDAARRASVDRITAVIPYYGYARQDRKAKMRQPISARVIADMLTTAGVDHVITIDIHAQQIQGFFSSRVPLEFLQGDIIFVQKLAELYKQKPFIIASADAGGTSRCRELAMRLNTDLVIVDKRRYADNQAEVMHVIGDVKGKNVIIFDDICDTAGSLCNAAKAIKDFGANEVYGAVTHAVLSGPACERIASSSFEKVFFSDSIPLTEEQKNVMQSKVEIISCAKILANSIMYVHFEKSKNEYYKQIEESVSNRLQ